MANETTPLEDVAQQAARFMKDIALGTDNVQEYQRQLTQLETIHTKYLQVAADWETSQNALSFLPSLGTDAWHGQTKDEADEILTEYYRGMSKFAELNIDNNIRAIVTRKRELEQKIEEEEGLIAKCQNMLSALQERTDA